MLKLDSRQYSEEAVITILWDMYYTRLCAFASAIIVLYDCIVSLDREIDLVWKKRWSFVKIVYIWHRYFGLSIISFRLVALLQDDVSEQFCSFLVKWETSCTCVLIFSSEAILVLWIWVVYNRSKLILLLLSSAFVLQVVAVVAIVCTSLPAEVVVPQFGHMVSVCLMSQPMIAWKTLWLPVLLYNMCLLVMFMYKGLRTSLSRPQQPSFGLCHTVYKRTLLNFLAIITSFIACIVVWFDADVGLAQIPVNFVVVFSITNCSRLLLNIRQAYYTGFDESKPEVLSWSIIAGNENNLTPLPLRRHQRRHIGSYSFRELEGTKITSHVSPSERMLVQRESSPFELKCKGDGVGL